MRVHLSRKLAFVVGLALGALATVRLAMADNEPVLVIPGRPGVPVMINGVDASGAVVEGEWGLNRPGVVVPTVILPHWGPYWVPDDVNVAPYFPRTGHKPRYGRLEIIPPHRHKPRRAEPYFRQWHSESDPSPATAPAPFAPPPVIVAPRIAHPRHAPRPPHTP
jgi:hypothetical protein